MSHPFPAVDHPQQLRTLTQKGIATYEELNERDNAKLDELRKVRADLMAELASVDDVMAHLRDTIHHRLARMRGDVISLLPSESAHVDPHPTELFTGPTTRVFEPGLPPEREAAHQRFNEAHDQLGDES